MQNPTRRHVGEQRPVQAHSPASVQSRLCDRALRNLLPSEAPSDAAHTLQAGTSSDKQMLAARRVSGDAARRVSISKRRG